MRGGSESTIPGGCRRRPPHDPFLTPAPGSPRAATAEDRGRSPPAAGEAGGHPQPALPAGQSRALRPSPPRGWRSPAGGGGPGPGARPPASSLSLPAAGKGGYGPAPGLRGAAVSPLRRRLGAVEQLPLLGPRPKQTFPPPPYTHTHPGNKDGWITITGPVSACLLGGPARCHLPGGWHWEGGRRPPPPQGRRGPAATSLGTPRGGGGVGTPAEGMGMGTGS